MLPHRLARILGPKVPKSLHRNQYFGIPDDETDVRPDIGTGVVQCGRQLLVVATNGFRIGLPARLSAIEALMRAWMLDIRRAVKQDIPTMYGDSTGPFFTTRSCPTLGPGSRRH